MVRAFFVSSVLFAATFANKTFAQNNSLQNNAKRIPTDSEVRITNYSEQTKQTTDSLTLIRVKINVPYDYSDPTGFLNNNQNFRQKNLKYNDEILEILPKYIKLKASNK